MEPRACTCHADDAALEILGAPIFDDSTGGSNWCLKRCNSCGALYDWRHEYTYLVNGASEDDTYVTRLDPSGARAALRTLFTKLAQRTRSTQDAPRTTRLPDDFGPPPAIPLGLPGVIYPTYALMELLRAREPMPHDELADVLTGHARFVAAGGAGFGWRTALTIGDRAKALMFAFYGAATTDQAQLQLARITPSHSRLELPSADLLAVTCTQADLGAANLAGSMLILADLSGTNLRGATLTRADCTGATLVGCDLRDADLRGTDFERADLTGADLRGARIDGASFLDTCLVDAQH